MDRTLRIIEKLIPKKIFRACQPIYHFLLAITGAIFYRFPTRKIKMVGITGTKGKTTTAEIVNCILEEAGHHTALAGTLRFKIGSESKRNLHKMTMPGRFFMQKFLADAVKEKCDWAIIEMTSEGAKQFRHKFMNLDALIVTNISPEHIESHGSYEKYIQAKLKIAQELSRSTKQNKVLIMNGDDKMKDRFLRTTEGSVKNKILYKLSEIKNMVLSTNGSTFTVNGINVRTNLPGVFNVYNTLSAIAFAKSQKIDDVKIIEALKNFSGVRGRMEKVQERQNFTVIIDYAHTKDSLEKAYSAYKGVKKICVLGSAGGGRDKWKRKEMGQVADKFCEHIILTNEDPYNEDPKEIIEDIAKGIRTKKVETIMDRREAIRKSFSIAKERDVVFITGKGTDPYIMGPNNTKTPWDDASVAHEELQRMKN